MNPFHRTMSQLQWTSILKQSPNGLDIKVRMAYFRSLCLVLRLEKQVARVRLPRKASTSVNKSCVMNTARTWLVWFYKSPVR